MRHCEEDASSPPSYRDESGIATERSTDESRRVDRLEERVRGLLEMKDSYFRNLCELEDRHEELMAQSSNQQETIENLQRELAARTQSFHFLSTFRPEDDEDERPTPTHHSHRGSLAPT